MEKRDGTDWPSGASFRQKTLAFLFFMPFIVNEIHLTKQFL